jgi:hypothetical protein
MFFHTLATWRSVERLTPVAVKETAKQKASMLIRKGYVQAGQILSCPHCSARFLLLLDSRDRAPARRSTIENRAADYFRTMIMAQHLTNHPLDRLPMPNHIKDN